MDVQEKKDCLLEKFELTTLYSRFLGSNILVTAELEVKLAEAMISARIDSSNTLNEGRIIW